MQTALERTIELINRTSRYKNLACWSIESRCNLRCTYCSKKKEENKVSFDMQTIKEFWQKTNRKWKINLSGGEPTLHPLFNELVDYLQSEGHFVTVLTNLVGKEFKINSESGAVVAAFHHQTEENEELTKTYIERLRCLVEQGVFIINTYILHPARLNKVELMIKKMETEKLPLHLKPLYGVFEGKMYPQAYDEKIVKDYFHGHTFQTCNFIPAMKQPLCAAGKQLIVIRPNGEVSKCFSVQQRIGSLAEGVSLKSTEGICTIKKQCNCIDYLLASDIVRVQK
jgi:MoaA/NifB/PqqE/SkfB family radical SAM enzyme